MSNQKPDSPAPRTPDSKAIVIAAVIVAAIVLPVIGYLSYSVIRTVASRLGIAPAITNAGQTINGTPISQYTAWQGTQRLNVLLMGIDQRPNDNPATTRTDTMIVLTLDPATHTAGMLSIPRDLYVTLPGRGRGRINTAHVYGGPALAMKTVEYNFGIPIQHYVRVNFNVVVTLVDLVGGIDVYVDQDINDPLYPNMNYGYDPFVISKGMHHMDGATALKYARTRHGSSDFYRMRRQQQIIMALRDRVLSTDALTKLLPNLPTIWQSLHNSVSTDLSLSEIIQLMLFAKDLPASNITRVVVDEKSTTNYMTPQGAEVLIPVRSQIIKLRDELYAPPPKPTPVVTPTPAPLRISIENGTSTLGLAASARTYLQSRGFQVVRIGDAKGMYERTAIIDYRNNGAGIQKLVETLGLSMSAVKTSVDASSPVDALIILGADYQPK